VRILFCGLSGYPARATASMNRYVAVARAMRDCGDILFVNLFAAESHEKERSEFGSYEVFSKRPANFLVRNFMRIIRPLVELIGLIRLHASARIKWINVYTESLPECVYYTLVAKLLGAKTIFHHVEKRTTFVRNSLLMRVNDAVLEKLCPFMFDRYITISTQLDRELRSAKTSINSLIIPPICDFKAFDAIPVSMAVARPYVMYCGSSAYGEVIEFVVDAFMQARTHHQGVLLLVVNGPLPESVRAAIKQFPDAILVRSNVEYSELIGLYKGANGLLVPLRPIKQDESRFPQKICEYLAARSILLTTAVGEVKHYFRDAENALVASEYSTEQFSDKIIRALRFPAEMVEIEERAYRLGLEKFDIGAYESRIRSFLEC
jgi:glycosyltransferase involved in cell wall biosynthesis